MYWGPTVLKSFAALLSLFRLSYCLKFCSKEDNRVTDKYENIMSSLHKISQHFIPVNNLNYEVHIYD